MSKIHITGTLTFLRTNKPTLELHSKESWGNGLYFIGMKNMDYGQARFRVHAVKMLDGACTTVRMNDDLVTISHFAQLIKEHFGGHVRINVLLTGGFQKSLRAEVEQIMQDENCIVFDHETVHSGTFPNWRQLMST